MNNKYEYFLCINDWNNWGDKNSFDSSSFLVCNESIGFIIRKDGKFHYSRGESGWKLSNSKTNWLNIGRPIIKPSTLEECLATINKVKYKENYNQIFKILGIKPPDYKPIEITDKTKNEVLNNLRKNRAFNGDSALRISDTEQELYGELAEQKIIRTLDYQKFWVEQ